MLVSTNRQLVLLKAIGKILLALTNTLLDIVRTILIYVTQIIMKLYIIYYLQVIIIYRHNNVQDDIFWKSSHWPTPWPQTTSYKKLIQFLERGLKQRKQNAGYVTQCLFTPGVKFILRYFYLNLQTCCYPLNNKLPTWITNQKAGYNHGVNVIIADFINTRGFNFCDTVIQLNYKYLKTMIN